MDWSKYGLKKNPYCNCEENELENVFVGRDGEIKEIYDSILTENKIIFIHGENGVGKTSLSNYVVDKICREILENDVPQYLRLTLNSAKIMSFKDSIEFEFQVYKALLKLLIDKKSILTHWGVDVHELNAAKIAFDNIVNKSTGISIGNEFASFGIDYSKEANQNALEKIYQIVQDWMKVCFENRDGGVIFVVENMEKMGSVLEIKNSFEKFRDNLFNLKGLRFIFSGPSYLENILNNSVSLQGYITFVKVAPISKEDVIELLISRREEFYKISDTIMPVSGKLFYYLYSEIFDYHLKFTMAFCSDFSQFLSNNLELLNKDRLTVLNNYLFNYASRVFFNFNDDFDTRKSFTRLINYRELNNEIQSIRRLGFQNQDSFYEKISYFKNLGLLEEVNLDNQRRIYYPTLKSYILNVIIDNKVEQMDYVDEVCSIWYENQVKQVSYASIRNKIYQGALCILPSDSSYILIGDLRISGMSQDLNLILNRENMKISLSFYDIHQVNTLVTLSKNAYSFIEKLTPGPISFIIKPLENDMRKFSVDNLYTDDTTISIRISNSLIERLISKDFPMPTTPIRIDADKVADNYKQALQIVNDRIQEINSAGNEQINRKIITIIGEVEHCGIFSTVIKEVTKNARKHLEILRLGMITEDKVREIAHECGYENVKVL